MKEFANLIDQVALTCKVRDIPMPFNKDVVVDILRLRHEDSEDWRALQAMPPLQDIACFLIEGKVT